MARYIKTYPAIDGHWNIAASRPPIESSDIELTAVSLRVLQVYAPLTQRAEYNQAVRRAADWLAKAQTKTNEDRIFQILGLVWGKGNEPTIRKAALELLQKQRENGGWAQLDSLQSDAYATGQALVALKESGALKTSDGAYKRGVQFLLNSQFEDGSWYVKSRAIKIQPYFENGFPHGDDQWISAAATNWATMALIPASR
jgi:squalene cyclase